MFPVTHPQVRSVTPGDPADKAGTQGQRRRRAVNDQPISFARQLSEAIGKHADQPIVVRILRDGRAQEIHVTPMQRGTLGVIGIGISDEVKRIEPGLLEVGEVEREENMGERRPDLQDARRPVHAARRRRSS